ncbi:isoprenyl transferase [Candidatus Omnitrophota bacterium]
MKRTPEHIAIIMDGNGRWAKKRGLPKIVGHKRGVESIKKIVRACIKFKVKYLTLYAFSTENWQRHRREIKALFGLLRNFLDTQMQLFQENNVRFCVIGDRNRLEPRLREKIEYFEKDTLHNDSLILNIALSYGGRQEIIDAARALSEEVKKGLIKPSQIDEKLFSRYLYTRDCPDPDMLIRTSGEMRISNFLLWQISYSEIHVTEKLWPDFCEKELKNAIEEFQKRKRRFGK